MSRESQLFLNLPPPVAGRAEELVPVRMVNEWVYCPRLAYLEWVEGEWAESGDTAEGRRSHRRVDEGSGRLPEPEDADDVVRRARGVTMSSQRLGIIAKMDVVDLEDGVAMPVDFKKGKRPHVAAGAYEPERVQVCAQAMILEDNGYRVEQGALWYVASRERVPVILDDQLRARTNDAISGLRSAALAGRRPPPLQDSPKCPRCSLAGICLPDETNLFKLGGPPRPLNPSDDAARPLHVQTPRARLRKSGERLVVDVEGKKTEVPLVEVSDVAIYGPASVTTPALHSLMREEIPVSWFTSGGWFVGHTVGTGHRNVTVREAQYRAAFEERRCLDLARGLVRAKVRNSRTFLRRNWRAAKGEGTEKDGAVGRLKRIATEAETAANVQQLLGVEGEGAAIYFRFFDRMLAPSTGTEVEQFSFATRNRRPPTDPVNAMLSLAYALLARVFTNVASSVGLDPYLGFYHRPRHGRPALALDLMEPFRPIVADSSVVQVINNGEVRPPHFVWNGNACALNPAGRRAFIAAFERRLEQETTHPVFGYRVTMRRLIEVQARLLTRFLQGEIRDYPHYLPR